jgi:hypothetical protein
LKPAGSVAFSQASDALNPANGTWSAGGASEPAQIKPDKAE